MRKRSWILLALVIAFGGALGLWWWRQGGEDGGSTAPAVDEAAIVRDKMRARGESGTDVEPARATGRVTVAQDGKPVAGALVLLSRKGLDDGVATRDGTRSAPLHVRTDEGGQFAFEGVPAGRYTLSASAEGFLPARLLDVVLRSGGDTTGLDLQLQRGGHRVGGTVTDVGGGPIEGALVRATKTDEGSPLAFFSRAPAATMADAEGRYALWLPDGHYTVTAHHADYVADSASLTVDGGPRTKDFTLTPGAVIEGRVLSRADRSPVAGAHVRWSNADGARGGSSASSFFGEGMTSVVTGSDGSFRIGGLQPGVTALSAVADHFATREPLEVPLGVAEEVTGIEILVDPAFSISGFVVARGDETTGLPGVMLGAYSMRPSAFYVASAPSESDGYFEILGVQPGTYNIGALGEQALPKLIGESVTVTDADVDDVLVVLDPGVHVRGRVEPAVAASISVEIDGENIGFLNMMSTIGNAFVRGRSGDDGTFDLAPVAPGKLTIVARADDGSIGRTPVDIGSEGLDDVVVRLESRARVAGRVTDAGGAPVEGVQVTFTAVDPGADAISMSLGGMGGMGGFGGGTTGSTDEDGRYVVRGLASGEHMVSVAPASGPALAWAEPADPAEPSAPLTVTITEGESREGHDLVVEARDGVISGVVVDEDGAPIADAWIRAYREQSSDEFFGQMRKRFEKRQADTVRAKPRQKDAKDSDAPPREAMQSMFAEPPVLADETGRFEVKGLRAGTYTLVAEAPRGEGRGRVEGVAIGARAEIEVLALGGLRGVVRSGSTPVTSYTLSVRGRGSRQRQVVDEAGRFSVERLDAGTYTVKATADEGVAEAEVTIAEGETAELELRLEALGTLAGRVVDAGSGEGIAGLEILGDFSDGAAALDLFTGKGPKTDGQGRFELKNVAPGKGQLRFIDPDEAGFDEVAMVKYELEGGEDEDLGTITGVKASDIPAEERGDLGLGTRVAIFDERPLSPDAPEPEASPPDGEGDGEGDPPDPAERLWVDAVTVGGAAEAAGVRPGDEIVSVRHVEVASLGAANAARSLRVAHVREGESVALELRRDGSPLRVTIEARARAAE